MPTHQVKISEQEFERGNVPSWGNVIVVEMQHSAEGYTTSAGIIVGFNTDTIYADGSGQYKDDKESHAADLAEVYGRVVRVPDQLSYEKEDLNHMSWLPEMEVEIGDYVWFHPLISKNCVEIIVGHKKYKCIPYEDLFVARKGGLDGDIVPLNGHCLLERVFDTPKSELDVTSSKKVLQDRGRVAFVGKPNIEYQNETVGDILDVQKGDIAYFTPGYTPIFLERKAFMANFDGDNLYYATQRRRIALTVRE